MIVSTVGKAAAAKILDGLVSGGVVDATDFNLDTARVSPKLAATGRSDQALPPLELVGRQFVLLRLVNGIPFYNTRLTITVRRDGRVESVFLFGPSLLSVKTSEGESPTTPGPALHRAVSDEVIAARHAKISPPDRMHETTAIMYFMPLDQQKGVVEPLRIYTYAARHTDGASTSIARRQTVGYSLREASEPPVLATEEAPNATGDVRQ
ncbi:MAG: hypothetical protein HS104_00020 [Polyangiaceae bacterium]|nr:hypothetical protein [Polyangiaceae bacterium]MBK8996505.1 hypothetical protein [Myxococcales bacterium]